MLSFHQLSFWEREEFLSQQDFVVVGAGIVGLSTALFLRKKFSTAKILVLERGYLPTGASTKNAGFACFGSPTELFDDLQHYPEEMVWETVKNRYFGLQTLFSLIDPKEIAYQNCGSWDLISLTEKRKITPEFIRYLNQRMLSFTGKNKVFTEDKTVCQKFGFSGVNSSYINHLEGSIDTGKLIKTLFKKANTRDVQFLFGTNLVGFENQGNEILLDTNFGILKTAKLLICTNGFASSLLDLDVKPARAQVLITKPIEDLKVKGTFHLDGGYYYFRNVKSRVLLGGGRNLDVTGETTTDFGTTELIQNALHQLLSAVILPNTEFEVDYSWSGIMGVGNEKKPIIKKLNNNLGIGVRMGGMGVAIGAEVGKKLAALL